MTDVALRSPVPAAKPTTAAKVTETLANARDKLEAPFKLIDDAYAVRPADTQSLWETGNPEVLSCAERWLASAPDRSEVETLHTSLATAYHAPADRRAASMLLGLLLESYPNSGKETREGYFATLLHDVMDTGVGPYVLAEACKETRRKLRFLPTVSELLGRVGEITYRLRCAVEHLDAVLASFDRCEAIVAAHAAPPAEWPEDLWFDAVKAWGRCNTRVLWADRLGPPPGEPGCLVPAPVIDRYRQARSVWARAVAA